MEKINIERFQMFPRGFLGGKIVSPPKRPRTQQETELNNLEVALALPIDHRALASNHHIVNLYKEYMNLRSERISFEFSERIILAALEAFGTTDFVEWLHVQHESPRTSDNHRDYIDDTILYLLTGRRRIPNVLWCNILSSSSAQTNQTPMSVVCRDFINNHLTSNSGSSQTDSIVGEPGSGRQLNASTRYVIRCWLTKTNGIGDLLSTLNVMYGGITT